MFDEQLAIDGHNIAVLGACHIPDLSPLLAGSEVRGASRLLPNRPGRRANPRRIDETVVNLGIVIEGTNDFAGLAHPDIRTGLYRNASWLRTNIVAPVSTAPYTRTAVLTWHGEGPVEKPVQVLPPMSTAADGWDQLRAILRLSFPEGLFDLT